MYRESRESKGQGKNIGDNFSFLELERGEFLLGLSDGMGSGSMACKESEMVLDLVERFLEAGFSVETAIRMMNSAMVMKGADDLYSTVDLCKINLYTGMAKLYKIRRLIPLLRGGRRWNVSLPRVCRLERRYRWISLCRKQN